MAIVKRSTRSDSSSQKLLARRTKERQDHKRRTPTRRQILAALGATGAVGLAGCASILGRDTADKPDVSFTFEYNQDTQRATISHDGGESIPAGWLLILGEGIAKKYRGDWYSLPGSEHEQTEEIANGDSITVDVLNDDFTIELIYESGSESPRVTVATYEHS